MIRPSSRFGRDTEPMSLGRVVRGVQSVTRPKRVLAMVGTLLSLLTLARAFVLFVESYSAIVHERGTDSELMELCAANEAAQSADFRALCLRKRAERSAPVLLKALLRACTTAFTDFTEVFSSPSRILMLVLFVLSGIALPVVKLFTKILTQSLVRSRRGKKGRSKNAVLRLLNGGDADVSSSDDDDDDANGGATDGPATTIVLDDLGEVQPGNGFQRMITRALTQRRVSQNTRLAAALEARNDRDDYGYPNQPQGRRSNQRGW
jgi:hypothetical protein